jgi:transcriptional regulator with XRE-family HTH domain
MHIPAAQPRPSFGSLLRHWRLVRRVSQLALATEADISGRHLSFLETGRAQPSREMVQLLATVLDVPLAEQNNLLVAAGYAPIYGERAFSAPTWSMCGARWRSSSSSRSRIRPSYSMASGTS